MSTVEITTPTPSVAASTVRPVQPRRGVAVVCEAGDEGRAALMYARALAAHAGVGLTVMAVARRERTDLGCGSCRQGAAFRNELACDFATGELAEARELIASADTAGGGEASPGGRVGLAVGYVLARGSFTRAVSATTGECGADVVVLPARRRGRLRRRVSRDRAERLRSRTSALVVVPPADQRCAPPAAGPLRGGTQ